jgi:periplasmic divalent cation tolerance protein
VASADENETAVLVVLTTVGNAEEATRIAHALVERRLAACVNVLPPIRSIFRWEGAVQEESELLLLTKTTAARFDAVSACIRELHSYDVPEIVALPAAAVERTYAAWLRDAARA